MNILLLEKKLKITEIYKNHLARELAANIIVIKNSDEGIIRLKATPAIHFIICHKNDGLELLNYVLDHELRIPTILVGERDRGQYVFAHALDQEKMSGIIMKVQQLMSIPHKAENKDAYTAIPINQFYLMKSTVCDVFIKLLKQGVPQYLKRINKGDEFEKENIDKYSKMGLKELFILETERLDFLDSLLEQTYKYLKSNKSKDVLAESFDLNQTLIQEFGISKETIKLAQETIKKMGKQVLKSKTLTPLLKNILTSKGSFSYRHAYLTCIFSYGVIPLLEWGGKLEDQFEKMTFVCFFHDMVLQDEKLIKLANKVDFYQANLTEKEKECVLSHANTASTLVKQFPHAPPGVDIIIKQHHGTTNGMGFTDHYTANISSMAIAFIVLEEFTSMALQFKELQLSIPKIIEKLEAKFSLPSFKRVVDALKQSIENGF